MDIQIKSENTTEISDITLKKMIFIFNALENGWSVTKNGTSYVFKKNHGGKKEIFLDDYLKRFMEENFSINNLLENMN
jgi:hypothetical protein